MSSEVAAAAAAVLGTVQVCSAAELGEDPPTPPAAMTYLDWPAHERDRFWVRIQTAHDEHLQEWRNTVWLATERDCCTNR